VVAVKVTVFVPAGTVTVAGTDTSVVSVFVSVTTSPDGPAGPTRVTVPVEEVPPTTEVGENAMLERPGASMLRSAVSATPPSVAVIVAVAVLETECVVTVKVVDVVPAVMVTLEGTELSVVSEVESETTVSTGAGKDKLTVAVDELPPITAVGDKVKPVSDVMLIVETKPPAKVVSSAPVVVGKSVDPVPPATIASSLELIVIALIWSPPLAPAPPR
jgi:hypothetical protein